MSYTARREGGTERGGRCVEESEGLVRVFDPGHDLCDLGVLGHRDSIPESKHDTNT